MIDTFIFVTRLKKMKRKTKRKGKGEKKKLQFPDTKSTRRWSRKHDWR